MTGKPDSLSGMSAKTDDYVPVDNPTPGLTHGPSDKHPGMTSVWNENALKCHICEQDPERQPDCAMCAGRGVFMEVPYCDDPWTEVAPNLFVGGLATNGTRGHAVISCETGHFDFVVSLAHPEDHNGTAPTHLIIHSMADGPFTGENVKDVEAASSMVVSRLTKGEKVLVRCMAGINRSSLVAALAMIKMGLTSDEAIEKIRAERSPYCLFNPVYVEHLHKRSAEIHGGGEEMGFQKHGVGDVLKDEDVQKTASSDQPEEREQRLAALAEENDEADG